ncbi:hypothetical protein NQ315_002878 [Exocentrus adspersus]|uniref:DNA-directed DNA polymerase n=1 Tax=Exocentrus adspersus TaxID=1586481 RepID=A0AAV8VFX9_9CUCU|nr:hypothetical protein NQ315_002878 [Exocentrus adspersus]
MSALYLRIRKSISHLWQRLRWTSSSRKMTVMTERIRKEDDSNKQKLAYFTLRFLNSYRFMACSLDKLANYLKEGVFLYEFIDSYEKLESTVELPTADKFYSTLTEFAISDEDYAELVWKTFKCRNIGEYSDIYLKTDVLLLTDVFEAFRDVCMEVYGLEAASFITLPGLSWQAMMKYTKVRLELLTAGDMLHFIRKSIRGYIPVFTSSCNGKQQIHTGEVGRGESKIPNIPRCQQLIWFVTLSVLAL